MPVAEIQMPDGRIGQFQVPDGTTPEQVIAFAQQQHSAGFFDRLGANLSKRQENDYASSQATKRGEQSQPEEILQDLGQGAGLVTDVAGEAIKSAVDALPNSVQRVGRSAARNYMGSSAGQVVGDVAGAIAGQADQFVQDNPRAARNIGAVANIAALAPVGKGAEAVLEKPVVGVAKVGSSIADNLGGVAKDISEGTKARNVEQLQQAGDVLRKNSSGIYKQMRDANALVSSDKINNIISDMRSSLDDSGITDADFHPKTVAVLGKMQKAAESGQGMGLDRLDEYRKLLGGIINDATDVTGKMDQDGLKASIAKNALDDAVESIKSSEITGGNPTAVSLLKDAQSTWGQYRKFDNVTELVRKYGDRPEQLKKQLQNFVNNPKKMRGFTATEAGALKQAANYSTGEKIMALLGKGGIDLGSKAAGSLLAPAAEFGLGTVVAGNLGGAGAVAASTAAKAGSKYIGRAKVERALKTIESRPLSKKGLNP